MPKLSDTQDSGTLASWNVSEGDEVKSGDVVAEVETDKATMDVEVFDSGTILKILVDEGTTVPLGGLMAVIGEEGEDISDILDEAGDGGSSQNGEEDKKDEESQESEEDTDEKEDQEESESEDSSEEEAEDEESSGEESSEEKTEEKEESSSDEQQQPSRSENGRIKDSPLARNMAEDQGIDLSNVEGSGPGGRIIKRDIESFEPSEETEEHKESEAQAGSKDQEVDVSQMRKTIARRLSESKFSRPHYYETIDIKAEGLIEARSKINDMIEGKVSFNDLVVKACASALRNHPQVNVSWQEDTILQHGDINIAIAVAIDEGLVTPVINNADQKGLDQISTESKDLAEKARNRDLSNDQLEGSTFTISNLGMFGIEEFTAIINPPN